MNNLTTLAAVKTYLGIATTTQDQFISSLIPRASDQVQRYCAQEFPSKSYAGYRLSGTGTDRIVLPGPPLLSVSAVQIGSTVVTASPDGMTQPGYAFQGNTLQLLPGLYGDSVGYGGVTRFVKGVNNVMVSWIGGYQESETAFVPTGNTVAPSTGGTPAVSVGVTYTGNGVALAQVGSAPAAGQFAFNAGVYSFSSADYNKQVTMTYYYVPAAVEQAAIEMVGLKLKQRDNLGIRSKSLAGENITYEDKGITPAVASMLMPYVRRAYS